MRSRLAALGLALALAAPAVARADDDDDDVVGVAHAPADTRARTAFDTGRALFQAGRFATALEEFSAGYQLSGRPLFLFNMGECARKLGDARQAREHYRRYLAANPDGTLAGTARARLEALGPELPARREADATDATDPDATDLDATVDARRSAASVPAAPARGAAAADATPPGVVGIGRRAERGEARPIWRRWSFWAGVGVAAVATTAVVVWASRDDCTGTCVDLR